MYTFSLWLAFKNEHSTKSKTLTKGPLPMAKEPIAWVDSPVFTKERQILTGQTLQWTAPLPAELRALGWEVEA